MPHRVLVVEDEPNIVDSLSFLMKQAGFKVAVARDGETAIRTIESQVPDLVLLDVMLPRRDGYDVCREIRANPDWNDVRVVTTSPSRFPPGTSSGGFGNCWARMAIEPPARDLRMRLVFPFWKCRIAARNGGGSLGFAGAAA
jgi:hypothetical protein